MPSSSKRSWRPVAIRGSTRGAAGVPAAPGADAEVTLTTEVHADVPIVPKPALVHEDEQTFVFIADGSHCACSGTTSGEGVYRSTNGGNSFSSVGSL